MGTTRHAKKCLIASQVNTNTHDSSSAVISKYIQGFLPAKTRVVGKVLTRSNAVCLTAMTLYQGSYVILNINFQTFSRPFPDIFRTFSRPHISV